MPLFRRAAPQKIGTSSRLMVAFRMACFISLMSNLSSERYFSMIRSSLSARVSRRWSRCFKASSCMSAGIGTSLNSAPRVSSSHRIPFILTRSITPLKSSSPPHGIWRTSGTAPSRSLIICMALKKSAPTRSSLFIKAILGTLYRSA